MKSRTPATILLTLLQGILVTGFVAACSSVDCPVENSVLTIYQLQKPDGTPDTLGIDTLWVRLQRTNGTDTLLVNRLCGTNATSFKLPVSHSQAEDALHLTVTDTIGTVWRDTIHVSKQNHAHFESVDCKPAYFHTITAVRSSHHLIDSVHINKQTVNYDTSDAHILLRLKARR